MVRYSRDTPLSGSCPGDARNDAAAAGGGDVVAPGAFDDGDVVLLAFVDGIAQVEVADGCDAEVEEIDLAGGVFDAFGIVGVVGGGLDAALQNKLAKFPPLFDMMAWPRWADRDEVVLVGFVIPIQSRFPAPPPHFSPATPSLL